MNFQNNLSKFPLDFFLKIEKRKPTAWGGVIKGGPWMAQVDPLQTTVPMSQGVTLKGGLGSVGPRGA